MAFFNEKLKNETSETIRQQLEANIAKEEDELEKLKTRNERLLREPRFLFLLAKDDQNKDVFEEIPTSIETESEAKCLATKIINKLLADTQVRLKPGRYVGIIVRKAFYNENIDNNVVNVFNNNQAFITSKEIVVTEQGTEIF